MRHRAPKLGDEFTHKINLAINQAHDLVGLIMYDAGRPTGLPVRVTANVHNDPPSNVMTVWLTPEGAERYRQIKDQLPIAVIYPED